LAKWRFSGVYLICWDLAKVFCFMLRSKLKVDSSSKGQKSFISREEKGKAAWGDVQWDLETSSPWCPVGCQVLLPVGGVCLNKDFGSNRCFLGRRGGVSPWLITTFGEHVDLLPAVCPSSPPLNDHPDYH
jgi:hypothetical protein